ncbi:P-loop containing nucleoside triphosphate hydrolase protein [Piedraia hortae CBS 480.64]|uniref:RNA helicase n=1 Tax=Piedraia hortae CBS 480.64 TaxID=1314780 RepID=A0A6A7CCW3_9PEZI|nr:P-loop containing nucleoside triphosphate hydrolase protein [Piedraia hortae CBS 480.64]
MAEKRTKTFDAITPPLAEWILDYTRSMGFERTTPIQALAIPELLGNKDLVVEAVTGSGKTLSFLIPLVSRILKAEDANVKGAVKSIVVAPTKELATQIFGVLIHLLGFHEGSAVAMHAQGGGDAPPGAKIIPQLLVGGRTKLVEDLTTFTRISPNVLVATPRRLVEVLQSSRVVLKRHHFDLLVLDEADRLLDPNFQAEMGRILEMIPKERRTGLYSASVSDAVSEFVRVGLRHPFKISAKVRSKSGAVDKKTPDTLQLYYLTCAPTGKLPYLKTILAAIRPKKTIIFVSTRASVDFWKDVLPSLLSIPVIPKHGGYRDALRAKNLARFRDTLDPAILLTTDVLARGIDLPDIDLVVHLDPPTQPKDFIHRCGRSGRAGRRGMAIVFLHENERDYIPYLALQGTRVEPWPLPELDGRVEGEVREQIRGVLVDKRGCYERCQRAFVSWVQAYSKTVPGECFDLGELDWVELGRAWGLLCWPKMPEVRRYCPPAGGDRGYGLDVPEGIDVEKLKGGEGKVVIGKKGDALRRKEKAWSAQKERKAVKAARREKKEVLRRAKGRDRRLEELIERARNQASEEVFEGFSD